MILADLQGRGQVGNRPVVPAEFEGCRGPAGQRLKQATVEVDRTAEGAAKRRLTPGMRPLAMILPPGLSGVDLPTLTGQTATIEEGLAALMAIPAGHLAAELENLDRRYKLPEAAWAITEAGSQARHRLAVAVGLSYRALVEPYWVGLRAHLDAERAQRGQILINGGVDRLLSTLSPRLIHWRPPVLEIMTLGDGDVALGGRGLELVPSAFVGDIPLLLTDLIDQNAAPRLVFSVVRDHTALTKPRPTNSRDVTALAALIGRTRARTLGAVGNGTTTTELAERVGVSLAAASQHAAVLRRSGLITTRRRGNAVLHALTPLGAELLQACSDVHLDGRVGLPG
jgi:DNA-binding transcriptional ArsR family regulator